MKRGGQAATNGERLLLEKAYQFSTLTDDQKNEFRAFLDVLEAHQSVRAQEQDFQNLIA